MSKIDFLKTIYTKFIDENSTVLSIGLLSNDDKIVLNQITNNFQFQKTKIQNGLRFIVIIFWDLFVFCFLKFVIS